MKIIDFKKEGNLVRFYLGDGRTRSYTGERWDIAPYEHNAGPVYQDFVKGFRDICFPFDSLVLEPCDGTYTSNSSYSKNDMLEEKVPCIIVVPKELQNGHVDFAYFAGSDKVMRYYFNQKMDPEGVTDIPGNTAPDVARTLMSMTQFVPEKDERYDDYFEAVAYATKCVYEIDHIKNDL